MNSTAAKLFVTILLAAGGGMTFYVLGLPAAWLSGAMVFVAVATLAGAPTVMPDRVRDALFVVIGVSMGPVSGRRSWNGAETGRSPWRC